MSTAGTIDLVLAPPSGEEVDAALLRFVEGAHARYGARLRGIYLFGSRARGDNRPDSDADVAIVLADDGWQFWREKMAMADPARHRNPSLVGAMRRDARDFEVAR